MLGLSLLFGTCTPEQLIAQVKASGYQASLHSHEPGQDVNQHKEQEIKETTHVILGLLFLMTLPVFLSSRWAVIFIPAVHHWVEHSLGQTLNWKFAVLSPHNPSARNSRTAFFIKSGDTRTYSVAHPT